MLLLDTNVISELRKVNYSRTDAKFIAWSRTLHWSDLFLSAITVYELELGVCRLEAFDHEQAKQLRFWLEGKILPQFEQRILPVDTAIARRSAQLQRDRTRQVEDTLIASTAYLHRMTLVTRNVDHFQGTGVKIINPWDDK